MRPVRKEPLRPDHLDGFAGTHPVGPMPASQWGEAVAYVMDGEVMAILGGWWSEGVLELGLMLSTAARRHPVTLHKMALAFIAQARRAGVARLRAWPVDFCGAQWLRRLGFEPVNSGAFERCLIQ